MATKVELHTLHVTVYRRTKGGPYCLWCNSTTYIHIESYRGNNSYSLLRNSMCISGVTDCPSTCRMVLPIVRALAKYLGKHDNDRGVRTMKSEMLENMEDQEFLLLYST